MNPPGPVVVTRNATVAVQWQQALSRHKILTGTAKIFELGSPPLPVNNTYLAIHLLFTCYSFPRVASLFPVQFSNTSRPRRRTQERLGTVAAADQ